MVLAAWVEKAVNPRKGWVVHNRGNPHSVT